MSPTPRAAALLAAVALAALRRPAARRRAGRRRAGRRGAGRRPRRAPRAGGRARGPGGARPRRARRRWRSAPTPAPAVRVRLRQAVPPDMRAGPARGRRRAWTRSSSRACAAATSCRRSATRSTGPLGLAAWHHEPGGATQISVFPDLLAARRLALSVRQGRFRDQGISARGPLGLGTEFELVRDYLPDDDIRQVNWRATARLGRPMSNQYRTEQDRDVMVRRRRGPAVGGAAPGAGRLRRRCSTRALDALTAVALVADEVGDRCGVVAFDDEVRVAMPPGPRPGRRRGARRLRPRSRGRVDADYELAFRRVEGAKRAFVLVLADLLEEAAARPLVEAMPVLDPPPRGRRRQPRRSRASRRSPRARRRATGTSPAPPSRTRCGRARDPRRRARPRPPAPRSSRRPPTRSRSACVAAYLRAKARAPAVRLGAPPPRHEAPEQRRPARRRSRAGPPAGRSGPVRNPSANPHSTSHGAVPERELDREARLLDQRPPAPQRGRGRSAPIRAAAPPRRPRRCTRARAGRGRTPGAGTRRRCPRSIASPPTIPRISPLNTSANTVPSAEQDAARERDQRDADVVGEHLGGERGGLRGVVVAPLRGRVGGGLQLGGDDAQRGARVAARPQARRTPRARAAAPTRSPASAGRSASRRQ